ncbi:hypothetical protein Acr_19g0000060 [Actinidia rufa]|uniref:Uncharacterized protein n=1 Tax=Actinidia rufa TaxID=165716 RepID=A0A7J0G8G2_9ERIC|nr:hypothetical protein Acr_19g0000060 [Actinidia rufa]
MACRFSIPTRIQMHPSDMGQTLPAMEAGLPFLNPYKNTDAYFRHGANFVVAGSTALPVETIEKLKNALFMVREIGGNDNNYALFQGKTIQEVESIVPEVVRAIKEAARLQAAIEELKQELPNIVIVYGAYYHAFQWLFSRAPYLGFDTVSAQKAYYGTGGDYNFSLVRMCSPGLSEP